MEKSTTGKLRSYIRKLKILCYGNYLELPFYLRNLLTRLKISNHQLRIETGRYNLPPANQPMQLFFL